MNEEELFCKLFPEYVVNGKPLSPYFDLFESGCEQSEKRIAELEKENAELMRINDNLEEDRLAHIELEERLKKENAELQHKVDTLQGFLDRDVEFDNLQKENAELKGLKDVATLIRANNDTVTTLMQLNNKLVSKSQQLTKAKELLERLLITSCNSDVLNLLPNCSEVLRVRVEAEQFISEVEK